MRIQYRIRHVEPTDFGEYVADLWHPAHGECDGWETMFGPCETANLAEQAAKARYPRAERTPVIVWSSD